MFFTYLRRELTGRRKQTAIIATGMAIAIAQIQTDITAVLPDTTVSTQADLAASVSGSLATASSMLESLGLWLSIAVLIAAFLTAILFTVSGVTRRTREFGTLKAIGWSNRRIVGQVAGESVVQGLIGGAFGILLGVVGVVVINVIAPTRAWADISGPRSRAKEKATRPVFRLGRLVPKG